MSAPVLHLAALGPHDITIAGAKMARLAAVAAHGFAVPRSFVVTTAAFRRQMVEPAIAAGLESSLADLDVDDPRATRAASQAIAAAVLATPVEPALAREIFAAYAAVSAELGKAEARMAVRSSATGEDAADASFAGQYDSFLGGAGSVEIVAAVKRVWASLFAERALAYRARRGIDHDATPIAVGVVALVDAKAAGVAFSVHPATGRGDRIVVEGNWGFGETVVQGLVSPDHVEIDKEEMRILVYRAASKNVMSIFDAASGSVVEHPTPEALRDAPALSDEEALAVAGTVRDVERAFGHPVDVEWALEAARRPGDPVTLLQVRPVTGIAVRPLPAWDLAAIARQFVRADG
jgi:pyruvate,water dikinase